jgi:phosphopantetheine adenylyltransferase
MTWSHRQRHWPRRRSNQDQEGISPPLEESYDHVALGGITDPAMLQTKTYAEVMQSLEVRTQGVTSFLHHLLAWGIHPHPNMAVEALPIHDPFGPTITDVSFQALLVSQETAKGGAAGGCSEIVCVLLCSLYSPSLSPSPSPLLVNAKRVERGMPPLHILCADLVMILSIVYISPFSHPCAL